MNRQVVGQAAECIGKESHEVTRMSRKEQKELVTQYCSWTRWGRTDERGAINLISPAKVIDAARLVVDGVAVSLAREVHPSDGASGTGLDGYEAWVNPRGSSGGAFVDQYRVSCHGSEVTHVDALCHAWDGNTLWNGRDPKQVLARSGSQWGGVEVWRDGIITRGVLLDIPLSRATETVEVGRDVSGDDLYRACEQQGVSVRAGDAVAVYCGRERWEARHGPYGDARSESRPGLDVSCLKFLRDRDAAVLAWDMLEAKPGANESAWGVHSGIFAFGLVLVDACDLGRLAERCRETRRWTFMFVAAPMPVKGGSGSIVNPLAIV